MLTMADGLYWLQKLIMDIANQHQHAPWKLLEILDLHLVAMSMAQLFQQIIRIFIRYGLCLTLFHRPLLRLMHILWRLPISQTSRLSAVVQNGVSQLPDQSAGNGKPAIVVNEDPAFNGGKVLGTGNNLFIGTKGDYTFHVMPNKFIMLVFLCARIGGNYVYYW